MHLSSVFYSLAFAALAQAHFSLNYPKPWGELDEDKESSFCDGYANASSRTVFPLKSGVINLLSTHETWTVGVILSTTPNPTSFDNFTSPAVIPFFQRSGKGNICFPIDIASSGISGTQDGANLTIQIIYDGGDGKLYQCASLTLSSTATIPLNETSNCKNVTTTTSSSASVPSSTSGGALCQRPASLLPIAIVTLILSGMTAIIL